MCVLCVASGWPKRGLSSHPHAPPDKHVSHLDNFSLLVRNAHKICDEKMHQNVQSIDENVCCVDTFVTPIFVSSPIIGKCAFRKKIPTVWLPSPDGCDNRGRLDDFFIESATVEL